jgi:hypothetical protein
LSTIYYNINKLKQTGSLNSVNGGRLVVFEVPENLGEQNNVSDAPQAMYDLTNSKDANVLFPKGGPGLRSAESSQEVVIKDKVPPKYIKIMYKATSV